MARYYRVIGIRTYGDSSTLALDVFSMQAGGVTVDLGPINQSIGPSNFFVFDFGADRMLENLRVRGAQAGFPRKLVLMESADGNAWTSFRTVEDIEFLSAATTSQINFPDPADKIVLLVNADTTIRDESVCVRSLSRVGNVAVNNTNFVFGGGSMSFNSGYDCVRMRRTPELQFGNKDFTLEMRVLKTANNPNSSRLWNADGDNIAELDMNIGPSGVLGAYMSSNGSTWNIVSNANVFTPPTNAWCHIAIERFGGTVRAYLNGVGTVLTSTLGTTDLHVGPSSFRTIGGQSNGVQRSLIGLIDAVELRVGEAKYQGDFTPPAAATPDRAFDPGDIVDPAGEVRIVSPKIFWWGGPAGQPVYTAAAARIATNKTSTSDPFSDGQYKIEGTVAVKSVPSNVPLGRRVQLIDQRSRRVLRETWSDPETGAYRFGGIAGGQPHIRYSVIAYDFADNFKAVIEDNIEPVRI